MDVHLSLASDPELRWYLLNKKTKETKIASAFCLFRQNGIEPILIKGWAAAANYPAGMARHFNDIDLAVRADEFVMAEELSGSDASISLNLDVHNELRRLDTVGWDELFAYSRLVDINGTQVRILGPEDHLRVLCTHWLLDGGAVKQRLWDIFYAVTNRPADFDWGRCLEIVPENRRRWIVYVIGLTHLYLGLQIDDLPFWAEAKTIPRWMIKCIESEWASGVKLQPVATTLKSPSLFLKQILKRIPPNPIRAVVEMEGSLDARTRIFYQAGSFFKMFNHPLGPATLRTVLRRKIYGED